MNDLLTLAEYKIAAGIGVTDTRKDATITQWIPWMSGAIRSFTERDFGAVTVTEDRVFEYDGSGYLDIDDASAVQSVRFTYPGATEITLPATDWTPQPPRRDDSPVFYYLFIPGYVGSAGSPEMGFTRNLDLFFSEHRGWALPRNVTVGATWGWPTIPGDVKMAAVWTLQEWLARPSGEALTSEAIEGWSRSWGGKGSAAAAAMAIPARARDILVNYSKVMA